MITKFQDVAHYYLGCKLIHKWSDRSESEPITLDANRLKLGVGDWLPILRKIETISDDAKREIYLLVFGKDYPKDNRIIWYAEKSLTSYPRWVLMSGVERLGIEINGDVWADCDLQKWKFNPNLICKYFISKGFDVFDLLSNGEAVS